MTVSDSLKESDIFLTNLKTTLILFIFNDSTILISAMKNFARKPEGIQESVSFEMRKNFKKKHNDLEFKSVTFYQDPLDYNENMQRILKFRKLYDDRRRIIKILVNCGKEIKAKGTFKRLLLTVSIEKRIQQNENQLLTLVASNYKSEKRNFHEVTEALRKQRFNSNEIFLEKAAIKNVEYDYDIDMFRKNRFFQTWETARVALQKKISNLKLSNWKNDLEEINTLQNRDNFVREDIRIVVKHQIQTYKNQCDFWLEKYETEMDSIDMDIQIIKEDIAQRIEFQENFLQEFDERQIKIDEYLKNKTSRISLLENITYNVERMQAWFRGDLARTYTAPKKKKGKGKAKNKKGKKKK